MRLSGRLRGDPRDGSLGQAHLGGNLPQRLAGRGQHAPAESAVIDGSAERAPRDRISMHPTNEELTTYMFGQPSTELLERIEEHMDDCGDCALTVARLVRALIRAPEPPDTV